ncbi:hypothetical protein EDD15DRAFT_2198358 [Pisolithus albus]|nr:hypothetical protein EDD15DRAFT_2198358 [Pisolithus albus]
MSVDCLKVHKDHLDNHEGQLHTILGEVKNHECHLQQVYGHVESQALLPMKLYNSCIPPTGMLKGPWGFIPAIYPNTQETSSYVHAHFVQLNWCITVDGCILLSQFLKLDALPNSSSIEEHRAAVMNFLGVVMFKSPVQSSSSCEKTPNMSLTVNDDHTRVTCARECAKALIVGKDCPLHRHLLLAVWCIHIEGFRKRMTRNGSKRLVKPYRGPG